MNKLMQGASLEKKSSGINSIRNSTNRSNNLGMVLATTQKDFNINQKSNQSA